VQGPECDPQHHKASKQTNKQERVLEGRLKAGPVEKRMKEWEELQKLPGKPIALLWEQFPGGRHWETSDPTSKSKFAVP
jgi:hypothetical protein